MSWWVWGIAILCGCPALGRAEVIGVHDEGVGYDYLSGEPITLPAARLSTNLFRHGAQAIRNRKHTVYPARFDESGRIDYTKAEPMQPVDNGGAKLPPGGAGSSVAPAGSKTANPDTDPPANGFPSYLDGQQYIWFLQDVRHYTNYSCTVTVDSPATFYLLVDNRVNDYLPGSEYDDPTFGRPDTQWVLDEGWKRVNTGLSPGGAGDYVGVDEGDNGDINQVYAIYSKTLSGPGSIRLGTEYDGNVYCLVVSSSTVPLATSRRQAVVSQVANRQGGN